MQMNKLNAAMIVTTWSLLSNSYNGNSDLMPQTCRTGGVKKPDSLALFILLNVLIFNIFGFGKCTHDCIHGTYCAATVKCFDMPIYIPTNGNAN